MIQNPKGVIEKETKKHFSLTFNRSFSTNKNNNIFYKKVYLGLLNNWYSIKYFESALSFFPFFFISSKFQSSIQFLPNWTNINGMRILCSLVMSIHL